MGEEKKKMPLSISEKAYNRILEIRKDKDIAADYCLRLGVKSAGCGIASYVIGFDFPTEKDEEYVLEDFKVIIEKIQLMYLAGKKVDFDVVDGEAGFVFRDQS